MNTIPLSPSEMSQIQIALSTRIEYLDCLTETFNSDISDDLIVRLEGQASTCRELLARIRGDK